MTEIHGLSGRDVLVTGAGGFIGSHLCDRLREAGALVHPTSRQPRAPDGMTWWQCELGDANAVANLVRTIQPEVVFHLASAVTGSRELVAVLDTFKANLLSTVNLMVAASEVGVRRIVLAGSMEEGLSNQGAATPCSPYAAAKLASSTYGRLFHALYRLPVVHLRLAMVYGPGQQDLRKLVPYVSGELVNGTAPRIGSGARSVDWVYITDVIDALLLAAMKDGVEGESIDIGSGTLTSIREIVERLVGISGSKIAPLYGSLADRPLEIEDAADVERTHRLLGWKATWLLDEGLRSTYDWYAERIRGIS